MLINLLKSKLNSTEMDLDFSNIYVCDSDLVQKQKQRYLNAVSIFESLYDNQDISIFSTSGRTEVGGNHTDHQNGKVLAASVNMDTIAVVGENKNMICIKSDDYLIDSIDIDDTDIQTKEFNTSTALIRGTVARFKQLGYKVGGFNAFMTSDVLKGSGISSSAAFEVMIGTILNHLYNDGKIDPIVIAQVAQYTENVYFNKPCGLMDQMACSVGGFVSINFYDPNNPIVEKVSFDFKDSGYQLCLVDTGGDHTNLSDEYGLMVREMKTVASYFNKDVLSQVSEKEFYNNLANLKELNNDRAILRAMHFFSENVRVEQEVDALKQNNIDAFKKLVIESGYSSYMYLQNAFCITDIKHQGISLALAFSEKLLKNHSAYRVHGGGLAGTIQAFVAKEYVAAYKDEMEKVFGVGKCHILAIRPMGSIKVIG